MASPLKLSFSSAYFNSSNYDTINQHYGVYTTITRGNIYLSSGVEYLHIMSDNNIHDDADDSIKLLGRHTGTRRGGACARPITWASAC